MDNDLLRLDRRKITNLQKNLANVVKSSHYVFTEMSKSAADIQARIENLDKKLVYLQKTSDQYLTNPDYIEMLSRQPVTLVRESPRDRRRRHSSGNSLTGELGTIAMAPQPYFLAELCAEEAMVNVEIERERLTEYRRHVKLVPVRREVLYYEGGAGVGVARAGPTERRSRKMRRSRSMRDGELAQNVDKATCLGFLELRPPRPNSRRRPHSVETADRLNFVPVLTAGSSAVTPSASVDMSDASGPAKAGEEGGEEVPTRLAAVPTVLVPVDVSGEAFERYLHLRRSLHGVEYQQRVVVRRPRRNPRASPQQAPDSVRRHRQQQQQAAAAAARCRSYDALEPQLAVLQDPSRRTAPLLPTDGSPRRPHRHSAMAHAPSAHQQPPPPPPRLATVKRSSSMPATPPSSSTDFSSWRHSSDLASSSASTGGGTGSSSGGRAFRRTFSQRAKDFFRPGARSRSHSAENALDGPEPAPGRTRSKSPFSWLFRGSTRTKAASVGTISGESEGTPAEQPVVLRKNNHRSRDRAKKARTAEPQANGSAAGQQQQRMREEEQEEDMRPVQEPRHRHQQQLASARPPTAVDCPDYLDSLDKLGRLLGKRETVIPANFTGSEPLQGIPLHKVKVWLRSGRDVIRNRRAHDRYSADALPMSVQVASPDAVSPPAAVTRSKSFFSRSGGSGASSNQPSADRKRCSAQEAGQRAKQAFAGQCVTRVSLSQSTSEHLDKLSHQFNRAVTLRRSYRHKRQDDRRSSSGNWSGTSSSTRPSRASSAGAQARLPRSLSKDSALGMHCSSADRSDFLYPTGAASSSSLSSLSTHPGGTPNAEHTMVYAGQSRLHYTVVHPCPENGMRSEAEPIYALPNKPKFLSSVKESPSHQHQPFLTKRNSSAADDSDDVFDSTVVPDNSSTETLSEENLVSKSSPVVKRKVPPPPPPRVDSLRTVTRGVIVSPSAPASIIAAAAASRKALWSTDGSQVQPMTDSWYSELLPYKSNTLPRNLSTRLRKRDSLPSGGGIADMYNSWPRATSDSPEDEMEADEEKEPRPSPGASSSISTELETSRMPSSSSSSSSMAAVQPSKSLNFAPRASLNVYDINTPTNACSAASTHRILKPQPLPAAPEERGKGGEPTQDSPQDCPPEGEAGKRASSPLLKQYRRLYSLNRAGGPEQAGAGQRNGRVPVQKGEEGDVDSEYEEEATMV